MATKRVTTIETDAPLPDEAPPTADQEAEDIELQSLLSELGTLEDLRVRVRQLEPVKGSCETYSAADFSIERVRSDYGAGKYHCTIIGPDGRAKRHRMVTIAARLEPPKPATPITTPTDVLTMLSRMQAESGERLMKWAAVIVPTLGTAIAAYFNRPRDTRKEFDPIAAQTAFFQQLALAKEMFGGNSNGADTLIKAIEVLKDVMPSGGGESGGMVEQLLKALPAIQGLIGSRAATPLPSTPPTAQRPIIIPPDPAPVADVAPAALESSTEPAALDLVTWIKNELAMLIAKAEASKDPELYGDVLIDDLPPSLDPQSLLDALKDETWLFKLVAIDRRVSDHERWFKRLRNYVVRVLSDELAHTPTETGTLTEAATV